MNKRWISRTKEENISQTITTELGIHSLVSQIIVNRGITNVEDARNYLFADYSHLHDPFLLNDMRKAVDKILEAIKKGQKITIYGDYDVDGVTSTTILMIYLRTLGINIDFYIPDRSEGYGLNKDAMDIIKERGTDLVVSVDCGITGHEVVDYCNEIGLEIIVTDHHEPSETLPNAYAVINPKRHDNTYPFRELAGAGVSYKLAVALQSELKQQDFSPDVRELLDIVAFGTVADVMPLVGENRVIVRHGLRLLNDKDNVRRGFKQLMKVSGVEDKDISAGHIGFQLAPRINALGRLQNVTPAVEMFLSDSDDKSLEIAKLLDKANTERRAIEDKMIKEAKAQLPPPEEFTDHVIVLGDEGWHTGIKGIVASRILEEYYRPVILCSINNEKGVAEGSARSIIGFDIRNALDKCKDLLIGFGGHTAAAGMKFKKENLEEFRTKLNEVANETLTEEDLIPMVKYDQEIYLNHATFDLVEQLEYLQPFGQGNPSPLFTVNNATILEAKGVGSEKKHLKLKVEQQGHEIGGIAFGLGHLADELKQEDIRIHLACSLGINEFAGRQSLQLEVKDIKIEKKEVNPLLDKMEKMFEEAEEFVSKSDYQNIGERDSFPTKVVGVTFEERQEIVRQLQEGETLVLKRQPENPVDPNAVAVFRENEEQVGFLKKRLAKELSRYLDKGIKYKCKVSEVTGEDEKENNLGVNILVEKEEVTNKEEDSIEKIKETKKKVQSLSNEEMINTVKSQLLGKYDYRPKQLEAITHLLNNEETLTIMGTGRGKSAIFQTITSYKALKENKVSIIVYPLRALVNDQLFNMQKKLGPLGLIVKKGTGDITREAKEQLWSDLKNDSVDIILTTPEFLFYYKDSFAQFKDKIDTIVVDEGHHVGKASDTYRSAYKRLDEVKSLLDNPTFAFMSATCDDQTFERINGLVNIKKLVIDPARRTNLTLMDQRDIRNKDAYLQDVVRKEEKTIIYVNSREKTVEIAKKLRQNLPHMKEEIGFYHAGLENEDRAYVERMFRNGVLKTIVSTSAFGEGIDIPDIRHVVHYHMSFNTVEFNQESGRAGRDGEKSYIHLLFGGLDARINDFIIQKTAPSRETLAKVYGFLKRETQDGQVRAELDLDRLAAWFKEVYPDDIIVNDTIFTALQIFKELKMVEFNDSSDIYYVTLLPMEQKIDLTSSIRYQEGMLELEEFEGFKEWVLQSDSRTLLSRINSPIYPVQLSKTS